MDEAATLLFVSGEVLRPAELGASELEALADAQLVADFHCREGWSRLGVHWRGVGLARLLEHVGASEEGRFVTLASGGFRVVLPRERAEDARVLLALEQDGVPLDAASGLPRLVGPSDWDCFLSVKGVDRIEVTREPAEATAERIALARIG
ncbi:MAG: molybdopterin-dependent oxidoreductase [Gaiella sp.]|nr:molybdopterin-dependent oxidoreductase [Gaiella sp.]